MDRRTAAERSQQILAFRAELAILEQQGLAKFSAAEGKRVSGYHDGLLADFSRRFDTDLSSSQQQLSWGMRLASSFGALAFSFAIFLFFEHYWDVFSINLQIGLATAAPLVALGLSELVERRFATRHYTGLAALVALACFGANLSILGEIYNISASANAFLAWGAFALVLASRYDLRVVLGLGLGCLIIFVAGTLTGMAGYLWPRRQLPELYLLASVVILILPLLAGLSSRYLPKITGAIRHNREVYAFVGLAGIYTSFQWLGLDAEQSLLPLADWTLEYIYSLLAFAAAGLGIWLSLRQRWQLGSYLSAGYLLLYALIKYAIWFWDDWPEYVFFLILGIIALGMIVFLNSLRSRLRGQQQVVLEEANKGELS
ncbi:DUF2157 domain-containing protein [Kiloniella laminariae]|uniref:DUF2157 domain-containing protein n=1 Tax=Kiloniella laminariae TaxID=454162 RepID=A0ABT4LFI1_9PROT|nr:DUF2157 domain-containing protein [Kiloniella laminariae]MCZ4279853.1 DUF2157 domain-containing protein [Kiloniella laminariae]